MNAKTFMSRYAYLKLRVVCYDARDFACDDLRSAVEYLKTQPQTGFTGLAAIAETVSAGPFKLDAKPMLQLSEIMGKTPAEVWEAFDKEIDEQREGLARRASGHYGTHPNV